MVFVLMALVGLTLGLLGGGGSILAVPVLVYAAGLPTKVAIATSLAIIGTTAAFALVPHALKRNVDWGTGAIFSMSAMIGGYLGGTAAEGFSGNILLVLFACMMLVTGLAMFRSESSVKEKSKRLSFPLVIAEGFIVGGATGLVGAGGGFLVVPALVLLSGMEMQRAVGTSLVVISLKSFAAFAGHSGHVAVDPEFLISITLAAIVGSIMGSLLLQAVPSKALKKLFSIFVVVMACAIIWQETNLGSIFAITIVAGLGLSVIHLKRRQRQVHAGIGLDDN